MVRIFFSLVLFKQSFEDINTLFENIITFERLSHGFNFETKFLIFDNSPTALKFKYHNFDFIKYLFNNKNIGFGKGHNYNLHSIDFKLSDIYIVVNPDVIFNPIELLNYIKNFEKSIYVCSAPLIKNLKGNIQYSVKKDPSILSLFLGRFKILLRIKIFEDYYKDHINYYSDYENKKINSSYLSGCFLLLRANIFRKIKGFDPKYFLHLEDADLTRMFSRFGLVTHDPSCVIIHKWARGSHKSPTQIFYLIVSMFIYFKKWGFKIF